MLLLTKDGSHTIQLSDGDITYHSRHGAIQESMHVFIEMGLKQFASVAPDMGLIRVFEMGFGTGLNALLAYRLACQQNIPLSYFGVEKHPLSTNIARQLNYAGMLSPETRQQQELYDVLMKMHLTPFESAVTINDKFSFQKTNADLTELDDTAYENKYNVIFYDAFAPNAQPELWTESIFSKMYAILSNNGLLVTYCSKGDVRRAMQAAGFTVEKLKGPPGKREMLRARKP